MKHVLKHWITTLGGLAIAGLQFYVANTTGGKYAALASAVLGVIAKDPNKA